jgi:6-phosphofructokinase 2
MTCAGACCQAIETDIEPGPAFMTEFLTVTMNPAIDLSGATERVVDTEKLRCTGIQHHPGGGGVNVARVLHRLGSNCTAYYPAGGARGRQLRALLDGEGVRSRLIDIAAETRESLCLHEECSGHDYRFVFPGPRLTEVEWRNCLGTVGAGDSLLAGLVWGLDQNAGLAHAFRCGMAAALLRC